MCSLNTTARGRPLIIYNGYEHRQVRVDEIRNLKAYRCIMKRCKGRLHTNFDNSLPRIVSEHVHPPNFDAEFKRKRRSLLRELAQKGNVSPSEIIEQARELELQYSTACEATRSSYAAERRYIQRYWNRQKQQEFAKGASILSMQQLLNEHLKMEAAEEDGSARGANLLSSELRKIDSVADDQDAVGSVNVKEQQPSEMTDLLQMSDVAVLTSNRLRPFGPMNIFVNIIYQQMLRDAMVKRSNSVTGVRRHYPNYQERLKLLADYCSVRSSMTDCDEQPQTNESDEQLEHLRDTVAMELGTVLTKTFWPKTFTGDDKLELFLDVIGKFLGVKHFSWG